VNELKSNINGSLFQILLTSNLQNHLQTPSQCRNHALPRSHSTQQSVLQMTCQEPMIHSRKALLGQSSIARILHAILSKSKLISRRITKSGSILARPQQRRRHNSRRILRIHDIIQRVTSWTRFQRRLLLLRDNHMRHHIHQQTSTKML
jgi:hypothetical protein